MKAMLVSILCLSIWLVVPFGQATDELSALSTDNPSVQNHIVDVVNEYRRNVKPTASDMLKVSWSKEAQVNAKKWAEKCEMKHSDAGDRKITKFGCGENIFMSSYPAPWKVVIAAFYNEVKDFVHGKGCMKKDACGHYTQVVWYRSNEMACAVAHCPNSPMPAMKYFYVCQHCPAGNNEAKLSTPYTSGPTCGDCKNNCDKGLCTNPCPDNDNASNCKDMKAWCHIPNIMKNCKATCTCTTEIK